MAQDITALSSTPAAKPTLRVAKAGGEAPKAPVMAADKLAVRRPVEKKDTPPAAPKGPKSPSAAVPGEDVRNGVSLTNTVLGPLVTIKQGIEMLANATFKSPLASTLAQGAVKLADKVSKFLPFVKNPTFAKGLQLVGRGLPFISAAILAFDGFATVKTFMHPDASGTRKALTAGRFLFNAIATGVSFIPGAGFIYSLAPALVGNGFEIAMAKLNASEAAKAAK